MTATTGTGGRWRPGPFGQLGDERLAQRVGAGDERAFAVVYERYHQMLYRYCRSILRDETDAQDALQSTFAAAFAALRTGQRDAPMRPWLFRIAHNESITVLRRRRPAFELSAASQRGTTSIEDQVAERAELSTLVRDLRELTDRQRSALVLRELSGLSHQEIAIALGTTVGAAKQTILEARRSLLAFAEGRAMACDEIRRAISDADGRTLRGRRVRAHLRECSGCSAFAAAIPARTHDLRALVPALPATTAAGLFGRAVLAAGGRAGGPGLTRVAAGAAAKTATAGAGFGANTLAGVAVVASTVGVTIGLGGSLPVIEHGAAGRGRTPAAALASVREPSGSSSPWLGMPAPSARALGPGGPGGARDSSEVAVRMSPTGAGSSRWAAGPGTATGAAGKGSPGTGGQAGQGPSVGWRGSPARSPGGSDAGAHSDGQSGASPSAGAPPGTGTARSRSSGRGPHGPDGSGPTVGLGSAQIQLQAPTGAVESTAETVSSLTQPGPVVTSATQIVSALTGATRTVPAVTSATQANLPVPGPVLPSAPVIPPVNTSAGAPWLTSP